MFRGCLILSFDGQDFTIQEVGDLLATRKVRLVSPCSGAP
jgi:hypothetical protein